MMLLSYSELDGLWKLIPAEVPNIQMILHKFQET